MKKVNNITGLLLQNLFYTYPTFYTILIIFLGTSKPNDILFLTKYSWSLLMPQNVLQPWVKLNKSDY